MTRIAMAILFGALTFSPGLAAADGALAIEQLAVEMAETPKQHAALATYYHERANEARAEAKRHQQMGRAYGAGNMALKKRMKQHCSKLVEEYEEVARNYDALAAAHEEQAK